MRDELTILRSRTPCRLQRADCVMCDYLPYLTSDLACRIYATRQNANMSEKHCQSASTPESPVSVIALFLPHNNSFPAHLQSPNMESAWKILDHAPLPVLYTHALYKYNLFFRNAVHTHLFSANAKTYFSYAE